MSATDTYIVYETTNLVNGKYYIGVHKRDGRNYLGSGVILKTAIKKYGRDNFIRETLKEFDNDLDAYNFERLIVDKYLVKNINCYNISKGGSHSPPSKSFEGRKHPKETREKMRCSAIERNKSTKYIKKLSDAKIGIKMKASTKEKLSIINKGKNHQIL